MTPSVLVFVEGPSDKAAIETLIDRLGRDRSAEGIGVVAVGGGANFESHLIEAISAGAAVAGLYDVAEAEAIEKALAGAGLGQHPTIHEMERLGFFACVRDLEEEFIRAIGAEAIVDIIGDEGEGGVFRKFINQPEWRGRELEDQLRRFFGTKSGRKVRYGAILANRVPLDRIPQPIRGVLESV